MAATLNEVANGEGGRSNRNIVKIVMSLWSKSYTSAKNSPHNTQDFKSLLIPEYELEFPDLSPL